jgi:hypothetical protein
VRLGSIEFGKIGFKQPRKFLKPGYTKAHCGCHAFEFGYWYFTILRGDCLNAKIEYGDVDVLSDD